MTPDTSGFYKDDGAGGLLYGPNTVDGPGFHLDRDTSDRTVSVDGWTWFDYESQAYAAYGLTQPA